MTTSDKPAQPKPRKAADLDPRVKPFLVELATMLAASWLRDHGHGTPKPTKKKDAP